MIAQTPYSNPRSLPYRARKRRFAHVRRIIDEVVQDRGRCTIIDVGGRELYWDIAKDYLDTLGDRVHITLVNPEALPDLSNTSQFSSRLGDGRDLIGVTNQQFDLAHSNSVIEHVGGWDDICRFAAEFMRVARRHYIQTPYYWFPIEPHYRALGLHFLPEGSRAALLTKMDLGFIRRQPDLLTAMREVQRNYLLDRRQMRALFPDFNHVDERFALLTKSLVAMN